MKIFLSDRFIAESKKLIASGSHADCEIVLVEEIFQSDYDSIIHKGTPKKIGGSPETPFIRRRLNDGTGSSGGYRLYLWAFKIDDEIFLLFIHPKAGRRSGTNITKEAQKEIVKEFLNDKKNKQNLHEVKLSKKKDRIIYSSNQKNVF